MKAREIPGFFRIFGSGEEDQLKAPGAERQQCVKPGDVERSFSGLRVWGN
jgi:hypothetical protein